MKQDMRQTARRYSPNVIISNIYLLYPTFFFLSQLKDYGVYFDALRIICLVLFFTHYTMSFRAAPLYLLSISLTFIYLCFAQLQIGLFFASLLILLHISACIELKKIVFAQKVLLVSLFVAVVLSKVGVLHSELTQEDLLLARIRYDLGFNYSTTVSVAICGAILVFAKFDDLFSLTVATFFGYWVYLESGSRSSFLIGVLMSVIWILKKMRALEVKFPKILAFLFYPIATTALAVSSFGHLAVLLSGRLELAQKALSEIDLFSSREILTDQLPLNLLFSTGVVGMFAFFISIFWRTKALKLYDAIILAIGLYIESGGSIGSSLLVRIIPERRVSKK